MNHTLPELPYAYDALEPYIDKGTMELHHTKHHQTHVSRLREALDRFPDLAAKETEDLVGDLIGVPKDIRTEIRNHGGGHVNHSFFWQILKKDVPFSGTISDAIASQFGSLDQFKSLFTTKAIELFGSGWVWLTAKDGRFEITSTANQDSPISADRKPVLALDMSEHAYYLKYQHRKEEYISAFFNVVNWDRVNELLQNGQRV
jgi:Fe-Mn family superoxide dismutase